MVPILHDSTNIQLEFLGKGKLSEAARCVIHEEINGEYYLEMDYPTTGPAYKELVSGGTIGAIGPFYDFGKPPARRQTRGIEFFDISSISTPIDGIVTFRAEHISRRMAKMVVVEDTVTMTGAAYGKPGPFVGGVLFDTINSYTDIGGTIRLESPKSSLSCLIGDDNSLASVYGGEFAFRTRVPSSDLSTVNLCMYHMQHRGSDKGASVHFGIDMLDLNRQEDRTNIFNAYVPYWDGEDVRVWADDYIVTPTTALSPVMAVPLDCTDAFSSQPTPAQLATYARNLLDEEMPWAGEDSITVDFINGVEITPAGTDVLLGDTVHVFWEAAGISKAMEVVAYDYDVLAERYMSIELGTQQTQYVEIGGPGGSRSSYSRAETDDLLSGKVSKSGDTMTGDLKIQKSYPLVIAKDTRINASLSNNGLSSGSAYPAISVVDNSERIIARFEGEASSNGPIAAKMYARNYNTSGASVSTNELILYVDKDGTHRVHISSPATWLNALGAVAKAGDTMTGDLNINTASGGEVKFKNTGVTSKSGVSVPSALVDFGAIRAYDKDGNNTFYSASQRTTDDVVYQSFVARRLLADNSERLNGLYLRIKADGTREVTFTDAAPWKTALGINNNASLVTDTTIGTSGTQTVNTYSSRKFSDYNFLTFVCGTSSTDYRDVKTIPISLWRSTAQIRLSGWHGTGLANFSMVTFTYASDTSVSVVLDGNKTFTHVQIIGSVLST